MPSTSFSNNKKKHCKNRTEMVARGWRWTWFEHFIHVKFHPHSFTYSTPHFGINWVSWNQLTWNKKVIEEDTFLPLGDMLFRRAYQKDKETFYYLHDLLQNDLEKHLFPKEGGTRGMRRNPYLINTKIRLSIAICFFFRCFSIWFNGITWS
jgi:hypothetical protein